MLKTLVPKSLRYRLMELRGRGIYSGYPDEYHCVFIHIPKTAGTSVASSLFGRGSRHVHWTEYQRANPRKFAEYFKFCFVRNPWDRLLSAYIFLKKGGMNDEDAVWSRDNIDCFDSFESFVHEWLTEKSIWSWVHFLPQHHWVCDESGQSRMDFVGRMENIADDFSYVARRLGKKIDLPMLNQTRSNHYTQYFTTRMREIVQNVYADDIALFGYTFEESPSLNVAWKAANPFDHGKQKIV